MRLTIAIPTIDERKNQFLKLKNYIDSQVESNGLENEVEVISLSDNRELSIGSKRQFLYEMAKGLFTVQVDDDDNVSENFVEIVHLATFANVDCIGYKEQVIMDGRLQFAKHSIQYDKWDTIQRPYDKITYRRTPFCKTPIKTELAKNARVPDMRFGEDHQFSKNVRPLLKTELFINQVMYFYEAKTLTRKQMKERYGI